MDEIAPGKNRPLFFLINSLTKGGAERQVVTLQKALGGKIVLLENTVEYQNVEQGDIILLSEKRTSSPFAKIASIFSSYFKLRRLIKSAGKDEVPVVISFLERSNVLNVLSSLFLKQKTILSVRINLNIQYRSAPLFKAFAKYFYPLADVVTSNSEGMRSLLVSDYNIRDDRARFIGNAYDIERIRKLAEELLPDPQLENILTDNSFLLSVNRLDDQKLIDAQISIFRELIGRFPDQKLVIVGDGPLRNDLLQHASALGLRVYSPCSQPSQALNADYDVYFLGLISNPYRLYKLSKCLLLTSAYESLPNVLIEGLICGATVMAADCKFGPREILTDDTDYEIDYTDLYGIREYGILLPVPDNNTAKGIWQDHLISLLSGSIGKAAIENVLEKIEKYSRPVVLQQWQNVIDHRNA